MRHLDLTAALLLCLLTTPLLAQDAPPIATGAFDLADLLVERGDWVYDFGAFGWPDGWSPRGLDPGRTGVSVGGIPFDDPITGRPLLDLFPLAYVGSLRFREAALGAAAGVEADWRAFAEERPLTEIRYRSSSTGLQSVSAIHTQIRNRSIRGAAGRLRMTGGYSGAGATGEYSGSRLRRGRQLLGRATMEFGKGSIDVGVLHTRHRVGAHAGVQPISGFTYESIYQRLGATVDQETAYRRTNRTDLFLTLRRAVLGDTLVVRPFRTRHRSAYVFEGDTTAATAYRAGVSASLGLRLLDRAVTAEMSLSRTRFVHAADLGEPAGEGVFSAGLSAGGRTPLGRAAGGAGIRMDRGRTLLEASFEQALPSGFRVAASTGRVASAPADRQGFGTSFMGAGDRRDGQTSSISAGWSLPIGRLEPSVRVFASTTTDAAERLLDASSDTVRVAVVPRSTRSGASLGIGYRSQASRGLYGHAAVQMLSASGTDSVSLPDGSIAVDVGTRLASAVPSHYAYGRFGARMLLFKGDLDLDLSLRARAWSSAAGRRLHAPTGILALPDPSTQDVPSSFILDAIAEGKVRTATVFLSVENFLSGTVVVLGNQLIPDYPFPERRLRFGVFWPILN